MMHARIVCHNGRVRDARAIYDAVLVTAMCPHGQNAARAHYVASLLIC
jgi:hypothetical protein